MNTTVQYSPKLKEAMAETISPPMCCCMSLDTVST